MTVDERIANGETIPFGDFPDSYQFRGHDAGKSFWIDWFSVPKHARGKGHGRAFYLAFEVWLRDTDAQPVETIRLQAADSGSGHSNVFWEKMGFSYDCDDPDASYEVRNTMHKTLAAEPRA